MHKHHIHHAHISAHHGYVDRSNRLDECIYLSERNPDIDMFEIDFVTYNNAIISAHDYEEPTILSGSFLSDWIRHFVPRGKIIWIDLKDTIESLFFQSASRFDTSLFFRTLDFERRRLSADQIDLRDWILLSSQFPHVQRILSSVSSDYQIISDLPSIATYLTKDIVPSFLTKPINALINSSIKTELRDLDNTSIIALDSSFFSDTTTLIDFIKDLSQETIIIYSLRFDDSFDLNIPGKKIISQYDYFYPIDTQEITADLFPKS